MIIADEKLQYSYARKPMIYIILSTAMIAAYFCFNIYRPHLGHGMADRFSQIVNYICAAQFGLATLLNAWRFATTRKPVVTVTRTGITDDRICSQEIPWSAIVDAKAFPFFPFRSLNVTWLSRLGWFVTGVVRRLQVIHAIFWPTFLVLRLDPLSDGRLNLKAAARRPSKLNASLGLDGVLIGTQALEIDCRALQHLCKARINKVEI